MKLFTLSRSLLALAAGALIFVPSVASADHNHKVTVVRDRDGDGHYNKKSYDVSNHGHSHGGHYDNHNYGHHYYGRPYGGYYGYRPYYRPYGYGYGYGYGYAPAVSLSYYSEPDYYSERRVYRGSEVSTSDSLAADVQRVLKRKGYYSGGIDGDIGPGSRSAIRAYQADKGLSVTGRIDRSLIRSLGIG